MQAQRIADLILLQHDGWLLEKVLILGQRHAARAKPFWHECCRQQAAAVATLVQRRLKAAED